MKANGFKREEDKQSPLTHGAKETHTGINPWRTVPGRGVPTRNRPRGVSPGFPPAGGNSQRRQDGPVHPGIAFAFPITQDTRQVLVMPPQGTPTCQDKWSHSALLTRGCQRGRARRSLPDPRSTISKTPQPAPCQEKVKQPRGSTEPRPPIPFSLGTTPWEGKLSKTVSLAAVPTVCQPAWPRSPVYQRLAPTLPRTQHLAAGPLPPPVLTAPSSRCPWGLGTRWGQPGQSGAEHAEQPRLPGEASARLTYFSFRITCFHFPSPATAPVPPASPQPAPPSHATGSRWHRGTQGPWLPPRRCERKLLSPIPGDGTRLWAPECAEGHQAMGTGQWARPPPPPPARPPKRHLHGMKRVGRVSAQPLTGPSGCPRARWGVDMQLPGHVGDASSAAGSQAGANLPPTPAPAPPRQGGLPRQHPAGSRGGVTMERRRRRRRGSESSRGLPPAARELPGEISPWFHHPPPAPKEKFYCSMEWGSSHPVEGRGIGACAGPAPPPTHPLPAPPALRPFALLPRVHRGCPAPAGRATLPRPRAQHRSTASKGGACQPVPRHVLLFNLIPSKGTPSPSPAAPHPPLPNSFPFSTHPLQVPEPNPSAPGTGSTTAASSRQQLPCASHHVSSAQRKQLWVTGGHGNGGERGNEGDRSSVARATAGG
ncbi:basic proline-rich protein-like [Indicator indicator]|uniref:basic proline-rich protein-like n=1 Tax=Indicator indicator TaxID=1002788 RepID=UPI0023DF0515|nr:basic proline-rich protein-like [Indicator indicator]